MYSIMIRRNLSNFRIEQVEIKIVKHLEKSDIFCYRINTIIRLCREEYQEKHFTYLNLGKSKLYDNSSFIIISGTYPEARAPVRFPLEWLGKRAPRGSREYYGATK